VQPIKPIPIYEEIDQLLKPIINARGMTSVGDADMFVTYKSM